MRTPEELRAILDALPRPIAIVGEIQIFTIDPSTGREVIGVPMTWLTSASPEEALFMLRYMLEDTP